MKHIWQVGQVRKSSVAGRQRAVVAVGGAVAMVMVLAGCGGGGAVGDSKAGGLKPVGDKVSASPSVTARAGLKLADDQASGRGGKQIIVAALANDEVTSAAGEAGDLTREVGAGAYKLGVSVVPQHGTATVSGTNLVYTPTAGYTGEDEFTYEVAGKGASGVSGTAVVRITVSAPVRATERPVVPKPPKPRKTTSPPKPRKTTKPSTSGGTSGGSTTGGSASGGSASGGSASGGSSAGTSGGGGSVYYKNCTAVRAAGAAPIRRGDPGYARHLDRDGDGVGCE
ncbi:excalibur calcium-binding domain-containing protein [Streptomyces sp. NPDC051561]|uniref:excalibur calcium-binding domain-containing protein n=1 Tax=Streptomyces sp. NPDC051561 TaxID=3365658 RepID=UPI003788CC02